MKILPSFHARVHHGPWLLLNLFILIYACLLFQALSFHCFNGFVCYVPFFPSLWFYSSAVGCLALFFSYDHLFWFHAPFVIWLSLGFISGGITLPLNGGLYVFAFCYSEVATLGRIEARTGGWHSPPRALFPFSYPHLSLYPAISNILHCVRYCISYF